jgi:hypothetical protein
LIWIPVSGGPSNRSMIETQNCARGRRAKLRFLPWKWRKAPGQRLGHSLQHGGQLNCRGKRTSRGDFEETSLGLPLSRSRGFTNDMWFGWVIDIGFPGPDRGEGGRYLLVPPDYDSPRPDGGFSWPGQGQTGCSMLAAVTSTELASRRGCLMVPLSRLWLDQHALGGRRKL